MPDDRHVWEIPTDEFVGVPYLFQGGIHPFREQSVAKLGRLTDYKHGVANHSRLLPDGFSMAELSSGRGFVLLDVSGSAVGVYDRRVQGYLLRLHEKARHQGLGYRFLAACLEQQDRQAGRCVWSPGTYSDVGLQASIRAHRAIVVDAQERGITVPQAVLAKMEWVPEVVPAKQLEREDVKSLSSLADPELGYKEAMAAVAMLGSGARLEALFDFSDPLRRPETFILALGKDIYQGFELTSREAVVAEIVDEYNSRISGRRRSADEFGFRKVSIESVCGHKNTHPEQIQAFLTTVVRQWNLTNTVSVSASPTASKRLGRH